MTRPRTVYGTRVEISKSGVWPVRTWTISAAVARSTTAIRLGREHPHPAGVAVYWGARAQDGTMLAYVFWHWPDPDADGDEYARALAAFHAALGASEPPWLRGSFAFRARWLPWAPTDGWTCEDWYLLEDSAALDHLNALAVSHDCREAHHRVAAMSAGGAGGLYRLQEGQADLGAALVAAWFVKPRETRYPDFLEALRPAVSAAGATLWLRQMVLGPAPEFCVRAPALLRAAVVTSPLLIPLRRVWPPADAPPAGA